jgi:putative ABC transport system permease protein
MPEWTSALRARLEPLRLPAAKEAAIVEELSQHLDDRRAELIAGGLDEAAATAATLAELARADLLAPRLAAVHPPAPLEPPGGRRRSRSAGLLQDLRYAARALVRQPGFSLVAIVTLAFGIGLNAAMFSLVNGLLLRPLPFPDASSIARLYRATPDNQYGSFAPADYLALQQDAGSSMRVAAYRSAAVSIPDPSQSAEWYVATASLFDVMGLPPMLGRVYTAGDEGAGSHRVVVLSYACWQSRFGADQNIIGKTVRGNDEVYEIIGVLPPGAGDQRMFGNPGLFSPLLFSATDREERSAHALNILVRRSPSISAAQGETFTRALGARLAAEFPAANERTTWRSEPLPPSTVGPTGRALMGMLLGLSGLVLLIACSNLANLLLTRALDRTRELAVRTALGASTMQLVRALVLEAALLAVAGGLGAVTLARWMTSWLRSLIMTNGGPAFDFSLDWRVLGFTLLTSLLTLFLCALGPILFAGRMRTGDTLRSGGRGTASRRHQRLRYALITAQFALAMMLLAASGYFVRGTANLVDEHFGWKADRIIQAELRLPDALYAKDADIVRFHEALIERVERLPDVVAVSVSYGVPHMGLRGFGRFVAQPATDSAADGQRRTSQPGVAIGSLVNGVSPGYFEVTQTRVLAGRVFDEHDTATAPPVVAISESLARTLFPSGSPIGRRVAPAEGEPRQGWEVIGVVQDVRPMDVARQPSPYQLYQAVAQDPRRQFTLAALTRGAPGDMAPSIRAAIADLDKDVETRRLMSATARLLDITMTLGMVRQLITTFALLGLGLAALGIYGAMTRMVAQRTDEIGLRMALGAQARNVIGLVLAVGGRIVASGAVVGIIGAFGLARVLRAVLPGMQVDAWQVGAAATLILMVMALIACYRPARRATAIDPMKALRSE